jgi:hypothetical protein
MARALLKVLGFAADPMSHRRQRQFVPSIAATAAHLEDRVMLSGAGGATAHRAAVAHHGARPLADTSAGQKVTRLFESILHTAPTGTQLNAWVHDLRKGVSVKVLKNDLIADARTKSAGAMPTAVANDPVISASNVSVSNAPASISGSVNDSAALAAGVPGLTSTAQPVIYTTSLVRQVPLGRTFLRTFSPVATPTSTTTTPTPTTTTSTSSSPSLATLLDNILSDFQSGTTLSTTAPSSTTVASEVNTVLSDSSLTGLAATTSTAVTSALTSLLATPQLSSVTSALETAGDLKAGGSTTLNPSILPAILNAILTTAANDLGGLPSTTTPTTTSTTTPTPTTTTPTPTTTTTVGAV